MVKKSICVLGSTGSVGTQTLEVAKDLGLIVDALSTYSKIDILEKQIRMFKPKLVAVVDENKANELRFKIKDTKTKILTGADGICEMAYTSNADTAVSAISGIAGLLPTSEAIRSGKNIALANKETLVAGGDIIKNLATQNHVDILPVDSEHSAIFQCLQGINPNKDLNKLILTASGGPFLDKNIQDLENVSPEEAIKHPNWSMGKKISIDSATMMNKGLEVIEAAHLFNMPVEKIDVIIHKESIIHSMIELSDNSIIAQMATPSMKIPIQYALTFPIHQKCTVKNLNLSQIRSLTFSNPNSFASESINLCKKAFNSGIEACIVLNAANEKAVELFLKRKIKFTEIVKLIKLWISKFEPQKIKTIHDIISLDLKVKETIEKSIVNREEF